jgi:hypothetical protein
MTDGTVTVEEDGVTPLEAQCNGPYSGLVDNPVSFTGTAVGGTGIYTYQWDFDYTGTFSADSSIQNPTWTYTSTGTYDVALRVDDGDTTDMCMTQAIITEITPPYVQVNPSAQTVTPDETVCIDILVNSDTLDVRTIGIQLTYDSTWFTVDSLTYQNLLGTTVIPVGGDDGAGLIDYAVARQTGNPAAPVNGIFVTICFTINPGAPDGIYPVDILDAYLLDQDGLLIAGVTFVDGDITIQACVNDPDVNDDGRINVLDMIRVGQHWNDSGEPGWIPEDINCDGTVNVLDMIIIGQNWTG